MTINRRKLFAALGGVPASFVPGTRKGPSNGCPCGLGTMWIGAQVGEYRGGIVRPVCDYCKETRAVVVSRE
jgi:hypothetical protein